MKELGILIGLIVFLSKVMGKKAVPPKVKKFSPGFDDDLYVPNERNLKSDSHNCEMNSDVRSKEVQKKPREDYRKRIDVDAFSKERDVSKKSSTSTPFILFEGSEDIKKELVKSIIYSEVIGKPKSLRK